MTSNASIVAVDFCYSYFYSTNIAITADPSFLSRGTEKPSARRRNGQFPISKQCALLMLFISIPRITDAFLT